MPVDMARQSTFTQSLRLNISLIIFLVLVQCTAAAKKAATRSRVRHRNEKNTPLALAWRASELESALTERGYNFSCCKELHWKNCIPEAKKEDGEFKRLVRRLCQRYLLPNDADRLEARIKYQAGMVKNYKFNEMMRLIVNRLSDYNETQEQMLTDKTFVMDDDSADCYWEAYYSFSQLCADPRFDVRARGVKNIFANACRTPGLDADKIKQYFSEVCSDFGLYT